MYCRAKRCSRKGQDLPESDFFLRSTKQPYRRGVCKVCYRRYLRGEPGFKARTWLDPKPLLDYRYQNWEKFPSTRVGPTATILKALQRAQNKGRVTATTVEQIARFVKDSTLPSRLYPEEFGEISVQDTPSQVPDARSEEDGTGREGSAPPADEVGEDQGGDRLGVRPPSEARYYKDPRSHPHTHDVRRLA